jgi:CheY-like chemotaxis protein
MSIEPPEATARGGPVAPDSRRRLRHELRTPVNHLVGFTELLLEDKPGNGGPWGDQLRRIRETGLGVLAPIDDLLEALRAGEDPAVAIDRIRLLLSKVDDACDLLDAEVALLGDPDAAVDLAAIRNAAVRLIDLVTGPLVVAAGDVRDAGQPAPIVESSPGVTDVPGIILVVDDNEQNREMLGRRLAWLGHTVEVASSGQEALDMLRIRPFDLLLLDVMMPGMDGFGVLGRLRADAALRELPVIMLSALDEVDAAVRCIELGADDYLAKPVDAVLLRARIGAGLERKRLRDTELSYLRQTAFVTGPAIVAWALIDGESDRDGALRDAIVREAEWIDVPKGETLFAPGDPGDSMYVVLSGRLRIDDLDERGLPRARGEVRRGSTIGELEMVTGQARAMTVTAVRDARLARIPRDGFERLAKDYPRRLTATTRDVIDRLRDAFQRRPDVPQVTTFALLPVSNGVPIQQTVDRLTGALAAYGPTLLLDREHLPEVLGHEANLQLTEDVRTERLAAWLNELELRYRYVVYRADPEPSARTRRCLRQADHILLVGQGQPPDDSTELMSEISRNTEGAPIDLLLLHDPATQRPGGTADWLGRWDVRLHHHLRLEDNVSLARLVRRLTGTSIDLVLGGGGARGCAHLGVLRAIEEAGIPIDAIGGTSIGALFGGAAAVGMSWQDMQSHVHSWSSSRRLSITPCLSFPSSKVAGSPQCFRMCTARSLSRTSGAASSPFRVA